MFEKWKHRRVGNATNAEHPWTVLAIAASLTDRIQLQRIFDNAGWTIVFTDTVEEALRHPAPIVVSDRDLERADSREAIQQLARRPGRRCVILSSFVADAHLAVAVISIGGYD